MSNKDLEKMDDGSVVMKLADGVRMAVTKEIDGLTI